MSAADQKRTWRISARLKQARASAKEKMSQAELARRVQARGVEKFPAAVASRIELGYTYATWTEVEALAAVLAVDPKWLAGIDDGLNAIEAAKPSPASSAGTKKSAKATAPPKVSPAAAAPAGMSAAAHARPPVVAAEANTTAAETPSVIITVAPPSTELAPIPIPPRGDLSSSDYRIKLGVERRKTEELMAKPGLSAAEWRQQRDYNRALTELLRTLVG